ncbi:hypothetical protein MUU48_16315 [Scandinavium sp. H11S7]|uniref:bestrophin-like domain n=1 Tax=Scandinavium hiltneri TaxID=2926519 RepID=UPI0021662634|nr:hypothetical protein [Scandinavium hiltneri]MCS2158456.1 hypothetical protein [Scandinavium hiltneri]
MPRLSDYPALVFVVCLVLFWIASRISRLLYHRYHDKETDTDNYALLLGTVLSILALIIGFTFSMASSRYDMRKNYEEEEANAIGTEWLRLDLLPDDRAAAAKILLRQYLDQRMLFYHTRSQTELEKINRDTSLLQDKLWLIVSQQARASPTPVMAILTSGMNDVFNTTGYTQAAWWNRIPRSAWLLLFVLAMFCVGMIEFRNCTQKKATFPWLLPVVLSFAFALIADIDSPRGGIIRIQAQNLIALAESLPPEAKT